MFLTTHFNRAESKICLFVWIAAVFYAIYGFSDAAVKHFQGFDDYYEDFTPGWNSRNRDKADFEWEALLYFLKTIFPLIILYVVLCQGILPQFYQYIPWAQIIFPLFYVSYLMGYKVCLLALVQPLLFHIVTQLNSKLLIWICNLFCLVLMGIYKKLCATEGFLGLNLFEAYFSFLLLYWMNLRCMSFSLMTTRKEPVYRYLAYCFYFPIIFVGPFISYEDFKKLHENCFRRNLYVRLKKLVFNVSRCLFWALFIQVSLHFVYVNAASFQIEFIRQLNLCTLCGYGYLMGQFFHLKYLVIYGLSTSMTTFENIPVPRLPRCIGRVHLYSDMWRYFDPGLHNFLKMCIFIPARNSGFHKLPASFLCFCFVYLWHGIEENILIWALLNFLGVAFESIAKDLYTRTGRIKMGERRLINILAVPLLAMSAVSNFYFFAGREVGDLFVQKVLSEPFLNKVSLGLVLYCCCEVSTEIRQFEARRMGC